MIYGEDVGGYNGAWIVLRGGSEVKEAEDVTRKVERGRAGDLGREILYWGGRLRHSTWPLPFAAALTGGHRWRAVGGSV